MPTGQLANQRLGLVAAQQDGGGQFAVAKAQTLGVKCDQVENLEFSKK